MAIPPPSSDYAWDIYSSKKNEVAGHVECVYTPLEGWSSPKFVESPFLSVHGLASGLHYGQQVFEGMIARRTRENNVLLFRPRDHAARMAYSAESVAMPPVPEELFLDCVHMAVALNAKFVPPADFSGNMYIRPFQFGSSCQIGLEPPDEFVFCVYVQPHIAFHGHGAVKALVAEDFDRAATRGMGCFKVGGNYAPVMRWSSEAKKLGFGVLLHVDSATQTYIDEFSTSGFIGVQAALEASSAEGFSETGSQPTIVIADSPAAIDSITSNTVSQLASSLNWNVIKRPVKLEELASFTEVLAVGTAAGLVSISSLHHRSTEKTYEFVSEGIRHQRLSELIKGIQRGQIEDSFGWCESLRYSSFVKT